MRRLLKPYIGIILRLMVKLKSSKPPCIYQMLLLFLLLGLLITIASLLEKIARDASALKIYKVTQLQVGLINQSKLISASPLALLP